jgi:magnesium transporter
MTLESQMADTLVRDHPRRAAAVLERLGTDVTTAFLKGLGPDDLARVLPLLSPHFGAAVIAALPNAKLAQMLERLPHDVAVRVGRRLGEDTADVLDRLPADKSDTLRALLRFSPDTAGGMMDPRVLALPEDLTAAEALGRVREMPENARYNLYVVDREQTLVGVLNLRELFLARPDSRLADLMVRNPQRLSADAGRATIVSHPGWREAHAIPVVDEQGRYLGALRYRTLRLLEESMRVREPSEAPRALGELLAIGAGALLNALTEPGDRADRRG